MCGNRQNSGGGAMRIGMEKDGRHAVRGRMRTVRSAGAMQMGARVWKGRGHDRGMRAAAIVMRDEQWCGCAAGWCA